MEISIGQVVYSRAGRDSGRKLVVVGIVDDKNVLVADGDLRRIEKPKRKKIKHLRVTKKVILPLTDKLKSGAKVSNSEIRKALAEIGDAEE
ncbi:MAG TPA: RNA-binding protein [Hungateiclostridium thermocellum]|jgi:large subunit ribosomal protein L14e|uniref:50S ribosomal protein L14e n=2 Tax=Acetivibrio thermocellus TaxID=1515 RepID=A3DJJ5_ACET2|nr:KOW domain-containing RNA-binding protein [Acetivibrio thermocellus]CDG37417.1 hypothetical protein CTHBC1_2840 [Acetivibrio thermocellus BC1]ABN54124.1 hypothetical protein Cthe_2926 [Acetivibrio thermocellus ATCC 27405]ADU73557.1 hypothetical protein Clo1313_0468 [Acetivibrio thermocellus DSM 1313]ALX07478.1 hypothetical protein AD2_00472 [Acetivibrio thermocellus AD2]ANV75217.1 hypothetical protein LQRI_0472 [Acetivibrio thermocellus DSM 2360]